MREIRLKLRELKERGQDLDSQAYRAAMDEVIGLICDAEQEHDEALLAAILERDDIEAGITNEHLIERDVF